LWRHYRECRRHKRTTLNALAFEVNAEANLLALQQELRTHTYRPGRSICFITEAPKPREVFAADFRDRVVHDLLVSHQERVFEPCFIHGSYACRKGKGTLAASDGLMRFLRQVTANGRRQAWALKLDVANFFPSIHKATLYEIIARHIQHPELLWLTRTLLFHDPTTNYLFQRRNRRLFFLRGQAGTSLPFVCGHWLRNRTWFGVAAAPTEVDTTTRRPGAQHRRARVVSEGGSTSIIRRPSRWRAVLPRRERLQ